MIRFYNKPECPFCYRVRLVMSYLGVTYQNLPHDDPDNEREWRSLTHAKTVPVLVDGDLVLTDSPVMLEYLQDLHGGLLPEDPRDRARVRSLVQFADNPLGRASREIVFAKRGVPEVDQDQERIAAGTRGFLDALPELTERLGDNEFFSDHYSVADAALSGRFALTAAYGVEIPGQFDKLKRWFESRLEDEFFVSASPPIVTDWLAGRPVREAS
ncbi:MAG: glutathione S-transferase family protein [Gammaproteobacteria bacterium]|jgi:glutathione S-transferase|nr:MAG: glutathione S-transferase family protein [Gammaproteobacteria bacterium]